MAVSDTQKVDLLYKQAFRVAKTDGVKDPTGEAIVSPLLIRGDKIWNNEQVYRLHQQLLLV